jgi:hypothetical protein
MPSMSTWATSPPITGDTSSPRTSNPS